MNKLAWLEAVARQFFHLINIAVVIDLINSYHFLSNETKLKLGFAYFKYVWDMLPERECLCFFGHSAKHIASVWSHYCRLDLKIVMIKSLDSSAYHR